MVNQITAQIVRSSSLFHLTLSLLHSSFVFLSHIPPSFLLFVTFLRAMPRFFNTVCIHLKCVPVLLAFSSALAAVVSFAQGRDHHFKCQTLKGFTINMDMPTISLTKTTPLIFLSPDCGRLRPSISRQTCGPTSWHLTEVMVINQEQITHTVIQYCWKRWDWVLWLLVVYERAFLKYYCTWKTPVNTV